LLALASCNTPPSRSAPAGPAWRPLPPLPPSAPAAPASGAPPPPPLPDTIAAAFPAVFKIHGSNSRQRLGNASGFVVAPDGLIVTNAHVFHSMLAGGVTEMVAVFDDGRVYELLPLAADAEADIAIGRLVAPRGHAFPHLRFAAASGAMRRGEPLAILGAPMDGPLVCSVGALAGHTAVADEHGLAGALRDQIGWSLLQVDAFIAPGSSGGPIVDARGAVVGVTVMGRGAAAMGMISYGVEAEQVVPVVNALLRCGAVERPSAGLEISVVDALYARQVERASGVALLPPAAPGENAHARRGLLVDRVARGRPGEAAGLREGDVILAINGAPVKGNSCFTRAMGVVHEPGRVLECAVWRPPERRAFSARLLPLPRPARRYGAPGAAPPPPPPSALA
jgi:S1-C subfamily serine protease